MSSLRHAIGHQSQGWSAYELLGVKHDCSANEAKRVYQLKLKTEHPDKGGDATRFQALQQAYNVVLEDIAARDTRPAVKMSDLSAHLPNDGSESAADKVESEPSASGESGLADPVVLAEKFKARGSSAFATGDFATACEQYTQAITWAPSDHTLWSNRSASHLKLGKFQLAYEDAQKAAGLMPRWPKAYYRQGMALRELGRTEDAIAAFRRSLDLDPSLTEAKLIIAEEEAKVASGSCWRILSSHQGGVYSAKFSPIADGFRPLLATASFDKTVRLWCARTMECLQVISDHTDKVTAVVWSYDGKFLATAALDHNVCVYNIQPEGTPKQMYILKGHTGRVTSLQFTPSCAELCTASTDKTARIWDISAGTCKAKLQGHEQHIPSIDVSPDGKVLATACADGTIRTWEIQSGNSLDVIDWKTSGAVNLCKFTPPGLGASGGSLLVTAHIDMKREEGRILMWDVERSNPSQNMIRGYCKELPSKYTPYRDKIEAIDIAVNEDNEPVLAYGGAYGELGVVDISSSTTLFTRLDEHQGVSTEKYNLPKHHYRNNAKPRGNVTDVKFSPSGRFLATTGIDDSVKVWDAETGDLLHTLKGHTDDIKSLCWSPDELTLVSASLDRSVRCWRCQWTPEFVPLQPRPTKSCRDGLPASKPSIPLDNICGVNGWAAALQQTPLI